MKGLDAFRIDGKVALITGGGAGIGKSCALLLSQAGAKVFIADIVAERAEQVKAEVLSGGGYCAYAVADLSVEENCRQVVEACIRTFGRLDILINSAGTQGNHGDLEKEMDTANFEGDEGGLQQCVHDDKVFMAIHVRARRRQYHQHSFISRFEM